MAIKKRWVIAQHECFEDETKVFVCNADTEIEAIFDMLGQIGDYKEAIKNIIDDKMNLEMVLTYLSNMDMSISKPLRINNAVNSDNYELVGAIVSREVTNYICSQEEIHLGASIFEDVKRNTEIMFKVADMVEEILKGVGDGN